MPSPAPVIKRSSSSGPVPALEPDARRFKRPYHHHHRLLNPVVPALAEPAVTDNVCVEELLNRSIGQALRESGFDLADPAALESFRVATEEYIIRFSSYVRQSMLSCRRIQPIPQDFEHALRRNRLHSDDLLPYLKTAQPTPTLLPSPPPEDEEVFKPLPFLGPQLSGEDERVRHAYIPSNFPEFPSKHTYCHTPVFTERERDPRKIRERATEDGRHGEEALRKLARAAFKDNQSAAAGRDKKLWGRRMESMDSMFEKTIKGLTKKMHKESSAVAVGGEVDLPGEAPTRTKSSLLSLELGPIVNCERDLWRRTTAGSRRVEEKPVEAKDVATTTRVESWRARSAFSSSASRIGSQAVVSTVKPLAHLKISTPDAFLFLSRFPDVPPEQPHNGCTHDLSRAGNPLLRRIARVLHHFKQRAVRQVDLWSLAAFLPVVLRHGVDMVGEGCDVEHGDQGGHFRNLKGLDGLLDDLWALSNGQDGPAYRSGVKGLDKLLAAQAERRQTDDENRSTPIKRGDPVVEISSSSSGAGKTQLLYYLAAMAVLPTTYDEVMLDGQHAAVVWIDSDGRFDAQRLRVVGRGIVREKLLDDQQGGSATDAEIDALVYASLQHVHVFRPESSSALLATLRSLETYLFDETRHPSAARRLHGLFIDSVDAFFWQDRLRDEVARIEEIGRPVAETAAERDTRLSFVLSTLHADLVHELQRLQRLFHCAVVFTRGPGRPVPPWGAFPSLRLAVQRDVVRRFAPEMSAREAEQEAAQRHAVVSRGRFSVHAMDTGFSFYVGDDVSFIDSFNE
ncbi:hypothetical protein ASPZODRAFT_71592 [Penicilliopsis zonata CBS 506.65]|uniref:Uncharacterized protein n=1 Tax=Penicilliopsis zonata CBS 506.65 TaxID=1073090 RepID=A0A1L9SBD1_9EURO|nr:hypothetical protein ASPZODRAFT_71592 [Penicilliopsis zonata CBS 506.65]OJJ44427.1 hypothetical protein ASPZODRAFT_71592 [Penicilliopsis zonata CBS 506.65]